MPRKVIDIVASDDAGQQEEQPSRVILVSQVSKPQAAKKQKRNEQPESKERKRKSEPFHVKKRAKRFSGLPKISLAVPIVIGGVVVILAAAFLVLTANAKLALKVKPVLEPIKMEEEVQVSPSQKELDFEKRILPT